MAGFIRLFMERCISIGMEHRKYHAKNTANSVTNRSFNT